MGAGGSGSSAGEGVADEFLDGPAGAVLDDHKPSVHSATTEPIPTQ